MRIKTARRKGAGTKQFIEVKVYFPGGRAGRFQDVELSSGLFSDWILLGLPRLEGVVYSGLVSKAASSHLGNSSHGKFLTLQGLCWNPDGSLSLGVAVGWGGTSETTMQIHYNESKGFLGAQVEERSPCSAPVAPNLSVPRSWKPQGQNVVPLGF